MFSKTSPASVVLGSSATVKFRGTSTATPLSINAQGSQGAAGPGCALVGFRLGVQAFAHSRCSTTHDQDAAVEQGRISRTHERALEAGGMDTMDTTGATTYVSGIERRSETANNLDQRQRWGKFINVFRVVSASK